MHLYFNNFFKYKKHSYHNLSYKKIIKVKKVENIGALIWVIGIHTPFITQYNSDLIQKYAGLLEIYGGYILYDIVNEQLKSTRRKV